MEGTQPQFHPSHLNTPHPHCSPQPSHHPYPHFHLPLFFVYACRCRPCLFLHHRHHHHHHHHPFPTPKLHCPNSHPFLHTGFSSHSLQNPCPMPGKPVENNNLEVVEGNDSVNSENGLQQQECGEDLGEEYEGEHMFVLTDEWMEFFAKSEAKRRLEKQKKQKGSK